MPFQSEKQRRYLWANEPEIARDWTDTYGSRIKKDDGGIMRVGFASGRWADSGPMSPGTSATGGTHAGGYGRSNTSDSQNNQPNKPDDRFQQYSKNIVNIPPPKEGGDWEDQRPKKEGFKFTPPLKFVIDQAKKFKNWNNAKRRQDWWKKYNKENPTAILPPGMDPSKYAFYDWENWKEEDWNNPENLKLLEEIGYKTHQPTGTGGGDGPDGYMGYPSYAAWLAAQGGGGGGGTTTPPVEEEESDFQASLTGTADTPDYYVGQNPLASNIAWGKQMGVDPRTMGLTSWAADGGRIPAAFGGIMDTDTGRRAYGLGSIFKKIGRAAKKVFKSPIGRGAIMAGLGMYAGGLGPWAQGGMWQGKMGSGFLKGALSKAITTGPNKTTGGWLRNMFSTDGQLSPWKIGIGASTALPFLMGGGDDDDDDKFDYEGAKSAYQDELMRIKQGAMAGSLDPNQWNYLGVKDGGRIGLSNGGDPLLREEYDKYVFEMKEMGLEPMSFEQFKAEARSGMYAGGQSVPSDYTMEDAMMTTTQDKLGGITDVMKQADLNRQGSVGQFYAADGGRIGYAAGTKTKTLEELLKEIKLKKSRALPSPEKDAKDKRLPPWMESYTPTDEWLSRKASGGRIGYAGGSGRPPITMGQVPQAPQMPGPQAPQTPPTPMPAPQPQMGRMNPMMGRGMMGGMNPMGRGMPGGMNPMGRGMPGGMNPMGRGMMGGMNPMMGRPMMRAMPARKMAQEGGLMDLGGMEKDYRNDGGFVPIGGEEKADDVPARLSKNEFVFTADAVRGAGDGDIDKGAEIMENVMKNLEQGGQISEETQGLSGAQEMFGVSERLSEVV